MVIGSGPNGLAAAITLAEAGRSVVVFEAAPIAGGGLRTDEVLPGVLRDHCSTVMPFAIGSPFLRALGLEAEGLEWIVPDVSFSHPLDGGRAGVAHRSIDATVEALGPDGRRYRRLVQPLAERWDELAVEVLGPVPHVPRHPLLLARFGLTGLGPSSRLADGFELPEAQGLIAGCAAHSVLPLTRPLTAAFALLFAASAHAHGWPVPAGGAQSVTTALVRRLESLGGRVEVDRPITTLTDLPPSRAILFDTNPAQVLAMAGDELSGPVRRRLGQFRHGPGVFKVDYLLDGPVPWTHADTARAPTVHVGGTFAECAAAEADVGAGRHPERPFVLTAQVGAVDGSRAPGAQQLLWAYTHVPAGSTVDMRPAIDAQLERFAPGFGDRVIDSWITTPAAFEARNANLIGGDITGGALDGLQLVRRPTIWRPYDISDRMFLCSASTPPGGGVHGMCGHLAASRVLATALR